MSTQQNPIEVLLRQIGVNPNDAPQYLKRVEHLLDQTATINGFSIPNPDVPDEPILLPKNDPNSIIGIRVSDQTHRFHSATGVSGDVGSSHANLTFRWMLTPDDYYSLPDKEPPPTVLDLTRSQRFTMLDSVFTFDDEGKNKFFGFGTGRTFPIVVNGEQQLYLGAIGNIMRGFGIFDGYWGSYVINGFITPSHGLYFQITIRLIDPDGNFVTDAELTPINRINDPDPGWTYIPLLGGPDPNVKNPVDQIFNKKGNMEGAHVSEVLKQVELDFDKGEDGEGLRTHRLKGGRVVATLKTDLMFNPFDPRMPGTSLEPIIWGTRNTEIIFSDRDDKPIGTLVANIIEGIGFTSSFQGQGVPLPLNRLNGFGPFIQGTGQLEGVQGMMSVGSIVSPWPAALSNVYMFRFIDPDGKFRALLG